MSAELSELALTPPHLVPGQSLALELHVEDPVQAATWFKRWHFEVLCSSRTFVVLSYGGQLLFLGRRAAGRPHVAEAIGELRVLVDDVDEISRVVEDDDVLIVGLHNSAYGLREFVVRSPFGIDLRFATPVPAVDRTHNHG